MRNNTLANCYKSYYEMWIYPVRDGRAVSFTCCSNTFRPENKLIIEQNIKDTWNSSQFQFQRKLMSKQDWSFCKGASCCFELTFLERLCISTHSVRNAIALRKTKLDYFARKITITPSFVCNNNCYFCYQALERKKRINHQLRDNLIKEIKEDIIPIVDYVSFSGGEPFFSALGRELIDWAMCNYPEKKYYIVTNGTLLHQFGLKKIMQHNAYLSISFYGMSKKTYYEVTGTDNFDAMYNNVTDLIKAGYKLMRFNYIVSRKSVGDMEDFCKFFEKHKDITGTVTNNFFEGTRYHKTMKRFEKRFSHLSPRLKFRYRSETILERVVRRFYNPLHSLRYIRWKISENNCLVP